MGLSSVVVDTGEGVQRSSRSIQRKEQGKSTAHHETDGGEGKADPPLIIRFWLIIYKHTLMFLKWLICAAGERKREDEDEEAGGAEQEHRIDTHCLNCSLTSLPSISDLENCVMYLR